MNNYVLKSYQGLKFSLRLYILLVSLGHKFYRMDGWFWKTCFVLLQLCRFDRFENPACKIDGFEEEPAWRTDGFEETACKFDGFEELSTKIDVLEKPWLK